jgi:type III secretory pathway component EscR
MLTVENRVNSSTLLATILNDALPNLVELTIISLLPILAIILVINPLFISVFVVFVLVKDILDTSLSISSNVIRASFAVIVSINELFLISKVSIIEDD